MDDIPDLVEDAMGELRFNSINNEFGSKEMKDEKDANADIDYDKKIPVTIITGYLGSGKSTLLEQIGKNTNKRLAIILNEFGDSAAIEKSVTIKDNSKKESIQAWLDLGNGCLCCTVKDSGVSAIEDLIQNSKHKIDYILLETTGIADPAPIARMFWLDDGLASNVYVDGVVTVVDSKNLLKCLDDVGGHWHKQMGHLKSLQSVDKEYIPDEEIEEEEQRLEEGITTAHLQIAVADAIILNKIDLLEQSEDSVNLLVRRIRAINSSSPVYPTSYGDIDLAKVLNLNAFEGNLRSVSAPLMSTENRSFHDDRISTITLSFPFFHEDLFGQVEKFLQMVLWENVANGKPIEIHRTKGVIVQIGPGAPIVRVVQGVRETYDIIEGGSLIEEIKENKLVFIGKNLSQKDLMTELLNFIEL